jgi:MFS family permease
METFGVKSNILAGLVVSIYILGFAIGPLIIAPMSEMYGRFTTYNVCNVSKPSGTQRMCLSGGGKPSFSLSQDMHKATTTPTVLSHTDFASSA